MESRFFLDIVVGKSTSIFQLFSGKNQSLLVRGNTFFILNFLLDIFNSIARFNIKSNCFTSQGFNKDLHSRTTSKTKDKMESRFFLDIVVGKSTSIFQLLSSKNQSLLVRGNTFFILNFLLNIFNGITGFNIKSDSFTSQSFDKYLHSRTTSKTKYKMESRFFLDIVIRKSSAIFQLLSGKNQSLLVRRDTFFILDFLLHIFNGITGFNIKSDSFTSQSFDKYL